MTDEEKIQLPLEQEEKLRLFIKTITPFCTDQADQDVLRKVGKGLEAGDELVGRLLEGATNFSYRVYLKGNCEVSIFVKVAFEYALWNPDRSAHYSLERITTEYNLLKQFSDLLGPGAPVATPYFCIDPEPGLRVMVAEWAPCHEPWAYQYVRGKVDRRVVIKAAEFIATVNSQPRQADNLNDGIKDSFRALYPIARAVFQQIISPENTEESVLVTYARKMGQQRFNQIIDGLAASYERSDVLLHGDTHALNILVESTTGDGEFAEKGEFFVCDWEMAHMGDKGRDPGTYRSWPIASAYFLAVKGEREKAYHVVDCMELFWNQYEKKLLSYGEKDESYMAEVYRSSIGWTGVYSYIANFLLKVQQDSMPFDSMPKKDGERVVAAFAYSGLRCMEHGFTCVEPTSSLQRMKDWLRELVTGQIESLLPNGKCCGSLMQ